MRQIINQFAVTLNDANAIVDSSISPFLRRLLTPILRFHGFNYYQVFIIISFYSSSFRASIERLPMLKHISETDTIFFKKRRA